MTAHRPIFVLLLAGCATSAPAPPPDGFVVIPDGNHGGLSIRSFYLCRTEVTWAEFLPFYADHEFPRHLDAFTRPSLGLSWFKHIEVDERIFFPDCPVSIAHWHTAMAYCDWLTARTGRKHRLPTEPEWEYAARAETRADPTDSFLSRPRPVGLGRPDAGSLHDMHGNVREHVLEPLSPPEAQPVLRGGDWRWPAAEGHRQGVHPAWFELDPGRPRSRWWFIGSEHVQGFRVAAIGGSDALKTSDALAPRIGVEILSSKEVRAPIATDPRRTEPFDRVSGRVRNGSDRTIEELELRVHALTPGKRPHWLDHELPGRPTFTWTYPVLVTSAHGGERARPLHPGETRAFEVDVPISADLAQPEHGARVTWVRAAP